MDNVSIQEFENLKLYLAIEVFHVKLRNYFYNRNSTPPAAVMSACSQSRSADAQQELGHVVDQWLEEQGLNVAEGVNQIVREMTPIFPRCSSTSSPPNNDGDSGQGSSLTVNESNIGSFIDFDDVDLDNINLDGYDLFDFLKADQKNSGAVNVDDKNAGAVVDNNSGAAVDSNSGAVVKDDNVYAVNVDGKHFDHINSDHDGAKVNHFGTTSVNYNRSHQIPVKLLDRLDFDSMHKGPMHTTPSSVSIPSSYEGPPNSCTNPESACNNGYDESREIQEETTPCAISTATPLVPVLKEVAYPTPMPEVGSSSRNPASVFDVDESDYVVVKIIQTSVPKTPKFKKRMNETTLTPTPQSARTRKQSRKSPIQPKRLFRSASPSPSTPYNLRLRRNSTTTGGRVVKNGRRYD